MSSSNGLTRRGFAAGIGASLAACAAPKSRPNILWLTCEDIGPHLGCYGDRYSDSPNLDRLAQRGTMYRHAWSNAPVCAPARTTIISGLYPTCTGAEHMRSMTRLPQGLLMYPCYLREAGYYTSNNNKEDYNLEHTGKVWDDSSKNAHWRNRKPGQPFFSIFNFTITHESQLRTRPHQWVHDPAKVRIPAYHPDTPEVRQDWAQYYDNITVMDRQAGQMLKQLEEDGLASDTIVFFYGDHGSGMPRNKRWPYNSGLRVPLIVHIPEKFRHLAPKDYAAGRFSERLVSFVDLAPTLLSLIGVRPPAHLQGHAFLGESTAPEQPYLYGFRGRMDERYDMVRTVRDRRYVYVRNYMPHRIYGQRLAYMFETPTTRIWKKLYDEGKLKPPKTYFWEEKPAEELYDLETDPDEVKNLASSPDHRPTLERLRKAQQDWVANARDIGFLPECEIHSRSKGSTPYDVGHDDRRYPMAKIVAAAELASSRKPGVAARMLAALGDTDSAVRYWAATGLVIGGTEAVRAAKSQLKAALKDAAPAVRVAAAEALGRFAGPEGVQAALPVLLDLARIDKHGVYVSLLALNAIDALGDQAKPARDRIAALPRKASGTPPRTETYVPRLIDDLVEKLS